LSGHRIVAFVFTLFTFYLQLAQLSNMSRIRSPLKIELTWPPGPELLEKLSSTAERGICVALNDVNHALAREVSDGLVSEVKRGVDGRALFKERKDV
jgi:hypothetical protein